MRRAIFPGTFDPFTIGHSSVVRRALTFIDEIVIGIGINENKNTHFPIEKREKMIRDYYRNEPHHSTVVQLPDHRLCQGSGCQPDYTRNTHSKGF